MKEMPFRKCRVISFPLRVTLPSSFFPVKRNCPESNLIAGKYNDKLEYGNIENLLLEVAMERLADLCWVLGEKVRLKIIRLLTRGERCVCELMEELDLSQAAISHHLRILRQAGFLQVRREGRWGYYSLEKEGFNQLSQLLQRELLEPVARTPRDELQNRGEAWEKSPRP